MQPELSTFASTATLSYYKSVLTPLKARYGSASLDQMSRPLVLEMATRDEPSTETIERRLVVLQELVRWAASRGYAYHASALEIDIQDALGPHGDRAAPPSLSPAMWQRLRPHLTRGDVFDPTRYRHEWLHWAVRLAITTGLGPKELCQLRLRMIHHPLGSIVPAGLAASPEGPTHFIPIFRATWDTLHAIGADVESQFVLVGPDNRPLRPTRLLQGFDAARHKAGLPESIRFDICQQTFIASLVQTGHLLYPIAGWLGHGDITKVLPFLPLQPGTAPRTNRPFGWLDTPPDPSPGAADS